MVDVNLPAGNSPEIEDHFPDTQARAHTHIHTHSHTLIGSHSWKCELCSPNAGNVVCEGLLVPNPDTIVYGISLKED